MAWRNFFAVLLSDDDDYENMLHIHLLDAPGRLLDSASIGGPYTSGTFRAFEITASDAFSFEFFVDDLWTVTLFDAQRLRRPWPEALGVSRPEIGLYRHFSVDRSSRSP